MSLEVRSEHNGGKKLFDWDPVDNTIGIVQRDMFYRVQLIQGQGRYRVLEKHPKRMTPGLADFSRDTGPEMER